MNASNMCFLVIVFAISFCSICFSQDIALDFDQAVHSLPRETTRRHRAPRYFDMEDAANGFVAKHRGQSAVDFLEAKIEEPSSRKPALLSLAKLAPTDPAAESALYRAVYGGSPVVQVDAVTAIAYLDPKDGRRITEALLTRPGSWHVRRTAVDMLVGLGNHNTLEMLKEMQREQESANIKKSFESAISQLEYRLTQVPANKQIEWAHQEILLWRTPREGPRTRHSQGPVYWAAAVLREQGVRFSREFVRFLFVRCP